MISRRWRPVVFAAAALVVVWAVAMIGYSISRNSRVTAAKVEGYVNSTDFSKLTGEARANALRELARRLNALSPEERRKARLDRAGMNWFEAMTEEEKMWFVEATLPTGFKQMIDAFEKLPEESRRRSIDQSLRRLREAAGSSRPPGANMEGESAPLSPELEKKIRTLGLQAFYSQSSAQTKAELAPVLEELQRVMEGGRFLRHP